MQSKRCTKCDTHKAPSEFSPSKVNKSGLTSWCRLCKNRAAARYYHTKRGICARIYSRQKESSKQRGHATPAYTAKALIEWAFSKAIFHAIYDKWVECGHQKMMTPSFDRMDDYKGYTLDNIKVTTWLANKKRAEADKINGINNKVSKAVDQMSLDGVLIKRHYSLSSAARKVKHVYRGNITRCCQGLLNKTGGFKWRYVND